MPRHHDDVDVFQLYETCLFDCWHWHMIMMLVWIVIYQLYDVCRCWCHFQLFLFGVNCSGIQSNGYTHTWCHTCYFIIAVILYHIPKINIITSLLWSLHIIKLTLSHLGLLDNNINIPFKLTTLTFQYINIITSSV